jgi:hypothetical protein
MSLINRAKADWRRHTTSSDGGGVSVKITNPATQQTADITCLATKHHIGVDTDGNLVNTKNAHISFSEEILNDIEFSVRDSSGEVNLSSFIVEFADSTGIIKKYVIREWFPDETVGIIVCILGDFLDD